MAPRPRPTHPPWTRLHELRLDLGLTCKQLGIRVNRSESFIYQLEVGMVRPSPETLHSLAGIFGYQPHLLAATMPTPREGARVSVRVTTAERAS
ncbi:MAG: helix-turn-helix domain-containing protein [Gammaproteobacteria bacterium]